MKATVKQGIGAGSSLVELEKITAWQGDNARFKKPDEPVVPTLLLSFNYRGQGGDFISEIVNVGIDELGNIKFSPRSKFAARLAALTGLDMTPKTDVELLLGTTRKGNKTVYGKDLYEESYEDEEGADCPGWYNLPRFSDAKGVDDFQPVQADVRVDGSSVLHLPIMVHVELKDNQPRVKDAIPAPDAEGPF